jgi:hypothetical protein
MPKAKELDLLLKDAAGATHDIMKYWPVAHLKMLSFDIKVKGRHWNEATRISTEINKNIGLISEIVQLKKDVSSPTFKETARELQANVQNLVKNLQAFKRGRNCPRRVARQLNSLLPAIKMIVPLSRVFIDGKIVLKKTRFKVKPLLRELENYLNYVIEYHDRSRQPKVTIRLRGNPEIYADRTHTARQCLTFSMMQ